MDATLKINGKIYQVSVSEEMPLLWVIRDVVGLTGTKFGCGVAQCGACSILIDGNLVKSCSMPVTYGIGKEILTIEGNSENLELLRNTWQAYNVPQCGYCQSGQLIAATALLHQNPQPTEDEIANFMSSNICRCGTYVRIKKAILKAIDIKNNQDE